MLNRDRGAALLVVLVMLLAITASSVSFIWFMNQQQTRAGVRYRAAAAMAVAEAGVYRALSILETRTPDGRFPGRTWRPTAHAEEMRVGSFEAQFTVSLADAADGAIVVTSVGEVGGEVRRLRARVYLTSPALLVALYGTSIIRLENPPAAISILPYGAISDHPWIHLASGVGIWFASAEVRINDPSVPLHAAVGPVDVPLDATDGTPSPPTGPVRILLARGAGLRLDQYTKVSQGEELRAMGINMDGKVLLTEAIPAAPDVDRAFYQSQAAANVENASLNEAAGKFRANADLAHKRDSLYSQLEFEQLHEYLNAGFRAPPLRGVIYVKGGVELRPGQQLHITDGALIAEASVHLEQGALLEVTHSAATRTFPGIITLDKGDLIVSQGARLRVHGLTYAARAFDVLPGAKVDIVGSVLANGPGFSFSIFGAAAVIRYDPAVLGTPGLRVPGGAPETAWVARWEELPQ
ncbi:MAG: hypothetical protein ACRDF5_03965 [bacterium]